MMVHWCNFTSSFLREDDSVDISLKTNSSCGYGLAAIAVISADEKVNSPPLIKTRIFDDWLCAAINRSFLLVNLSRDELIFSTSFSVEIDVFCALKSDSLAIIALRDGSVRVYSVENQCEVTEWNVTCPCPDEGPTFVGLRVESNSSIILVKENGDIFRITFTVNKSDGIPEIKNYECHSPFQCNSKVYSSCFLKDSYGLPSILLGSNGIFHHRDEKYNFQSTFYTGSVTTITKICSNKSETLVVYLSHGKLFFYCSRTMICLKVFDMAEVQDFTLLEEEDGEDLVFASLLDSSGQHMLWLFGVSDFSCRFQRKVNHPWIADTTSMSDGLYFLDVKAPNNSEELLDAVILHKITESNPSIRLDNLLKKKLFSEAEKFALEFKLDFQVIHKAQCLDLMERMQSSGDYSQVTLLSSLLDKVEDIDFMVNLIQISKEVDFSALKTLLLYCLERLQADDKEAARFGKLIDDVNRCLNLLDTYIMLWHSSKDESWTTFSTRKILDSFCRTVIKGEWMQAWVLWERHWQQCVKEIECVGQVMAILNKFPQGVFSSDVVSVLEVYAKGVISHIPEAIDEISSWVVHKVRSMERMKNWPKAALDFAERMLLLLSNSAFDDQSIILTKKFSAGEVKLGSASLLFLQSAVESLKDISYIYSEFDVKVKLSEYEQEQKQLLAILLLKKVSVEKYDEIASHYLMNYLNHHQLSLDDVITEIIEEVYEMTNHPSSFRLGENVPIEKLIALTERMKDPEKKGKCILLLMKTYPLPWNMKLSTLINSGLMLDHPISETIKLQLNCTNALSILKKYHLEKLDIIRDFHRIIKYIVQCDKDEMVEDCLTIAITESNKDEVYTVAVKHCFMKREYERAFKIMEPLPKKTVIRILSAIVHKLHALLLLHDNNELEYLDILKMCELYVAEMYEEEIAKSFFRETALKELTGIHYVKRYYNLEMQLEDAYLESPVLQNILKQLIDNPEGLASKIEPFLQVQQLSDVFRWSVDETVLQLLKSNGNVDALFKLISKLIASTADDALVDILWWALSSLLGKSVNDDLVQLLKSISCRGLRSCSSEDLSTHVEISRFLKIWLGSWDLKTQKSLSSRARHYPPFSYAILHARHPQWIRLLAPQELLPRIVSMDTTRQLWYDMLLKSDCSSLFSLKASKQCNAINKDAKEIHDESNLWLKFQVDSMITWNSAMQQESSETGKLEYIITLLRRVETSKEFDPILMIGLLFCFEKPLAWTKDSISSCNANYRCMLFNATIAMALGQMLNISDSMKQYEDIYFSCLVYKRLTVLGLNIREGEYFQMSKESLMKKIVGHKKITEDNIEELCNMLHVDVKSAFMRYIMSKLLSWTPQYQVKTSLNAQEECVVTNSTDHILKSFWFIRPIFKEEEILSFVKDIWPKINLYYYELYEVLLEILTFHNADMKFITKQKDLIRFLRKYHRHSSPSATEIEVSGNMGTMPEISRWRLPLLISSKSTERSLTALIAPSSFVGNIISAEVTFLNYPVWVAGPQIDDFDASRLCLRAIKNEMDTHLKDYRHKRDWHPYPSEEVFLQNVNTCIMKVENMKMATALIKYIMGKLPQGVDQLMAAEMCVQTARKWVETEEDNVEEAKAQLEKIEWQYKCLSVMHVLHQNGLGNEKYLDMLDSPNDVISELYQDAPNLVVSVAERAGYGVNWAATKIASIFSINIVKFKLNLITMWISSRKEEMSEFYDSFIGGELFASERQLYSLADDDDMRRLIYVCKSMDKNKVLNHLESIAYMYDEVNESLSTVAKLRVMLCMSQIDYEAAAEQAALRGITNLGHYIMKLFLLIPLEKVGVVHSISEFDSMDVQCIVKNLLQRNWQSNVGLAAKFCLVTSIFNHSVWENILKIMINSSMCQLLVEILPLLRHHSFFMGIKVYRNAWKVAVEGTFSKANNPMTSEEQKHCLACLKVMHLCPFMGDLDWQEIADACLKRSKSEMAALLLPFLSSSDSQELKKKILNNSDSKDVISRIQSLSGHLPICSTQALRILQGS